MPFHTAIVLFSISIMHCLLKNLFCMYLCTTFVTSTLHVYPPTPPNIIALRLMASEFVPDPSIEGWWFEPEVSGGWDVERDWEGCDAEWGFCDVQGLELSRHLRVQKKVVDERNPVSARTVQ